MNLAHRDLARWQSKALPDAIRNLLPKYKDVDHSVYLCPPECKPESAALHTDILISCKEQSNTDQGRETDQIAQTPVVMGRHISNLDRQTGLDRQTPLLQTLMQVFKQVSRTIVFKGS